MAETARALWYVGPNRVRIRSEALELPYAGSVRVRATYGAISRGTESLVAGGRVPASEYQRMRAPFMAGDFPFPVKYGYATVGTIEGGQTVFALHPHQTVFDVPADAAVPVPPSVPARRAVLAANMETALNAVWDANGTFGTVAVVGAGVVGALTGFVCRKLTAADV